MTRVPQDNSEGRGSRITRIGPARRFNWNFRRDWFMFCMNQVSRGKTGHMTPSQTTVYVLPAGLIRVLRESCVSLFICDTWFMPNINESHRKLQVKVVLQCTGYFVEFKTSVQLKEGSTCFQWDRFVFCVDYVPRYAPVKLGSLET